MNSNGGFIDNRLKYIHTTMKLGLETNNNKLAHGAIDATAIALDEMSIDDIGVRNINRDELARNDIEFLKSVTVNEGNMQIIKEKLISSAEYRMRMLKDHHIELRVEYPYFYTYPDLVINDIKITNSKSILHSRANIYYIFRFFSIFN